MLREERLQAALGKALDATVHARLRPLVFEGVEETPRAIVPENRGAAGLAPVIPGIREVERADRVGLGPWSRRFVRWSGTPLVG